MNIRYLLIGAIVGGAVAYFRVKSNPTAHTPQAPGFGR